MRHISVILLGIVLAACNGGLTKEESAALTPEQKIFKLANEINIAFEPAVAYALQEKCTATVVVACHDPGAVKIMLRLREEATAAINVARGTPDAAAAAVLATAARRILAALQAELLKTQTQGARHGTTSIFTFG